MIKKALIITVGGTVTPIVEAVRTYKCEIKHIYFVCSGGEKAVSTSQLVDGQGDVVPVPICKKCGCILQDEPSRKNIILQSGYTGSYEKVILDNPDDFEETYNKLSDTIKKAKKKRYAIISDFTGGTKTMSSVLAMLSVLDFDINLSLTTGRRRNTEKVQDLSIARIIPLNLPRVRHIFKIVDTLVARYFYNSAKEILAKVLQIGLETDIMHEVENRYYLCEAFTLWDRFDYNGAYRILRNFNKTYPELFNFLLQLLGKNKCSEYEKVFDLFYNAERQAFNGYYDNAVARLYRALELFAQIRLKKEYSIDTSHLENSIEKVPDIEKWEKKKDVEGRIYVGLKDSYQLLLSLSDPIGFTYEKFQKELHFIFALRLKLWAVSNVP